MKFAHLRRLAKKEFRFISAGDKPNEKIRILPANDYLCVLKTISVMKKIFIILTCIAVLASCSKGNEWDSDHTIDINVKESLTKADGDSVLTPAQIVRKAFVMRMDDGVHYRNMSRGWSEAQRDTINNKLKMWSTDIISEDGRLQDYFDGAFINVVAAKIVDSTEHVIAYIPRSVLAKARTDIIEAYNAHDYDEVYRLFYDAYTAIPISNSAYEKLVAEGHD